VAEFSASDAAFTGFRIVWERPLSVLAWAVLAFVFSLGQALFISVSAGAAFAKFSQLGVESASSEPALVLDLFRQVAPTYAVLLIAWLVLYAVVYAAMNRAVLRPAESRLGYLRLAADELRQLGLFALLIALAFGVYIAVFIAAFLMVVLFSLAVGQAGPALAIAILAPLVFCAVVFLAVRLSLASPLTFATGRIDLAGAWRLTRGRFWPIFGAYLIAVALSFVVLIAVLAIALAAVAVVGGLGALAPALQPDLSSPAALATPARLVYQAVSAVGTALVWPITMSPPAAIYRALAGGAR
jgi:hypothetical protein